MSDAFISLDVNCSPIRRSCEGSSLLPYVSLFEGTSSDLERNTGDEHHVTAPDSYQNNAPMQIDSDSMLVMTDGDHGIMVFDLVPKSSQAFNPISDLFSDQEQPMYGGVITDDDFDIESDFDMIPI